jgi:tetratricopeptide (TPR) repeat protein
MENYSGFLEHTDVSIGRLVDSIEKAGELDDTLILYIVGDNGASGDPRGAITRYRTLLDSREAAWITGSYNSEWHDDSQLQVGLVYRDDLRAYADALKAFQQLAKDFPHSILLDDAVYERAVTYEQMGKPGAACKLLARLRAKWPDSKFELELAPQMRERLACTL